MAVFEVYSGSMLVGHSNLEHGDPPMGVAFGRFVPNEAYATIQHQCIENQSDQSLLSLVVKTPQGETIECAGVGILDYSRDVGEEGIEINVLGIPYPAYEILFPKHVALYDERFK